MDRIDPAAVALAHDAMASEYDRLDDLWYPWLFAQIHEFIAERLPGGDGRVAVDLGCGTGFQSFLLARAGYRVTGYDLAGELLKAARAKTEDHARPPLDAPPLFQLELGQPWVAAHHARVARLLDERRRGRAVVPPTFLEGDIQTADLPGGVDVITCCGSVLSFVDGYAAVIERAARALRPGGRMFLEVEQRWSLDLLWPIVDRLVGGALEYEQDWAEIARNLLALPGRSVRVDYPFVMSDGRELTLPIWLFSPGELAAIFSRVGLRARARLGVHQVTNLLPSTVLHRAPVPPWVRRAFEPLRRIERVVAPRWPFWRLGCSAVYCLERT